MKKVLTIFIFGVLTLMPGAIGQGQAPARQSVGGVPEAEQATRQDILALLEVLHSARQTQVMLDTMKEQMLKGMRTSFLQEHPNASPELLKKLDAVMGSSWDVLNVNELLQAGIPVYQKYLSHEDVVNLISFYSSPAGQHYLDHMPALIKEAGEIGGNVVKSHMSEINRRAEASFADFQKYLAAHPEELGESAKSNSDK